MNLHRTTGNWQLGTFLTLVTVTSWGALPIVLMIVLSQIDAIEATWFRFVIAATILGFYLIPKNKLPSFSNLQKKEKKLLAIATFGLAANYYTYLDSLLYISPGTAQVLIQIAPIAFLLISVKIFKESFSSVQKIGVLVLIFGLGLFFNQRLFEIVATTGPYQYGIFLIVVAAITWAIFAASQKQLLVTLSSQGLLFYVYLGSALFFTPLVDFSSFDELDTLGWSLLIFASINTVIAYGSLSEAMNHLEGSRVSALLTLVPLASLACVEAAAVFLPDFVSSENLSLISYSGALLVVIGSILAAIGKSFKRQSQTT